MSDTQRVGTDPKEASEPVAEDESLLGSKGDPVEGPRDIADEDEVQSAAGRNPD